MSYQNVSNILGSVHRSLKKYDPAGSYFLQNRQRSLAFAPPFVTRSCGSLTTLSRFTRSRCSLKKQHAFAYCFLTKPATLTCVRSSVRDPPLRLPHYAVPFSTFAALTKKTARFRTLLFNKTGNAHLRSLLRSGPALAAPSLRCPVLHARAAR